MRRQNVNFLKLFDISPPTDSKQHITFSTKTTRSGANDSRYELSDVELLVTLLLSQNLPTETPQVDLHQNQLIP